MYNLWNFDIFSKMSEKNKAIFEKMTKNEIAENDLILSVLGMLEYDNIPNGFEPRFLELYKIINGNCGIAKFDDMYIPFIGGHADMVDHYGLGTHYVGADMGGTSYDFEIGKTGVVAWNNKLGIPDILDIRRTASVIAETWTSVDMNILYCRYAPLFSVKNAKIKAALDTALKNIQIGKPTTFLSDLNLTDIGLKDFEQINLTDVRESEKLQYLFKSLDDVKRNFYNRYGVSLSTTSKMAQQTKEEINQTNALAMIYPIERLKSAQKMCDEMNALWGTNISVHFSEVWQIEYNKYCNSIQKVCDNVSHETSKREEDKNDNPGDL